MKVKMKSIREQIVESISFNLRNMIKGISTEQAVQVSFKIAEDLGLNTKLGDTQIKLIHAIGIGAEIERKAREGK